jgi:hypothetical protein
MNGQAYCCHIKPNGMRCKARPLTTGAHCFFHSDHAAQARRQAQQRGGRNRRAVLPLDTPRPALATFKDLVAFLGEMLHQVRTRQLDHRVARVMASLCSVLLRAMNQGELERLSAKIEELEALAQQRQEEAAMQVAALCDGADDGGPVQQLEDFEVLPEDARHDAGGGLFEGRDLLGRGFDVDAGGDGHAPPASDIDDLFG